MPWAARTPRIAPNHEPYQPCAVGSTSPNPAHGSASEPVQNSLETCPGFTNGSNFFRVECGFEGKQCRFEPLLLRPRQAREDLIRALQQVAIGQEITRGNFEA